MKAKTRINSLALLAVTFLAQACVMSGTGKSECHVVSEWDMSQEEIMPYAMTFPDEEIELYRGCPEHLDMHALKKGVTEEVWHTQIRPDGIWHVVLSHPGTDEVQSDGAEACVYQTKSCTIEE